MRRCSDFDPVRADGARAAKREVLKLFALAPVRRGEGKGEGSAA